MKLRRKKFHSHAVSSALKQQFKKVAEKLFCHENFLLSSFDVVVAINGEGERVEQWEEECCALSCDYYDSARLSA
jgi:hypothetical protein